MDTASIIMALPNVCGVVASASTLDAAVAMGLPVLSLNHDPQNSSPKIRSASALCKTAEADAEPSAPEATTKSIFARVAVSRSAGGTVLVDLTHLVRLQTLLKFTMG